MYARRQTGSSRLLLAAQAFFTRCHNIHGTTSRPLEKTFIQRNEVTSKLMCKIYRCKLAVFYCSLAMRTFSNINSSFAQSQHSNGKLQHDNTSTRPPHPINKLCTPRRLQHESGHVSVVQSALDSVMSQSVPNVEPQFATSKSGGSSKCSHIWLLTANVDRGKPRSEKSMYLCRNGAMHGCIC